MRETDNLLSHVGTCFIYSVGLLMCMCVLSLLNSSTVYTVCECVFIIMAYRTSAPRALSSHSGLIDLWRRFSPQ